MRQSNKWLNSTGTRTYYAWRSMRSRCLNPKNPSWGDYGGRGIAVCDRWVNSFDAFVEDMGEAPEGQSLDRIDVNKDYFLGNCRWASAKQQANNKRTNVRITYRGQTKTRSEWAEHLGIGKDTLFRRMRVYGMDLSKALTPGSLMPRWEHGTRTGYERYKCRCPECREANNKRHKQRRQRRKLTMRDNHEEATGDES